MANGMYYLGVKLQADLYECKCGKDVLDNLDFIRQEMLHATDIANMNVDGEDFHRLLPQGISAHLTLAESYMDVYTWPEYRYADVDIHTCGENAKPDRAMIHIISILQPSGGWVERRLTGIFDEERTKSGLYLPPRQHPDIKIYSLLDYRKLVEI